MSQSKRTLTAFFFFLEFNLCIYLFTSDPGKDVLSDLNLVKVDSLLIYKEFLLLRPSPPCSYHDQVLTEEETEPMLGEPVSKLKTKSATFTPHTPPLGTTSPALAFPVGSSICPCEDRGSVRGSAVETLDIEMFS